MLPLIPTVAASVAPQIVSGVIEVGKSLIDRIFPNKVEQANERAKAELALATLAQEGRLQELATSMSAIISEAQSEDPWTSRARPSFLYVMYVMILWAIPMGLVFAVKPDIAKAVTEGVKLWLAAIPSEMWTLFGVGYLGYTGMRGLQQIQKAKKN